MSLCPREREGAGAPSSEGSVGLCLCDVCLRVGGIHQGRPCSPHCPQLAESNQREGEHASGDMHLSCTGTPDFLQRGALWRLGQKEGDGCGAANFSWRNSVQRAFFPAGGGISSQEPGSSWVFTCPESVGRGRPGVISIHCGRSGRQRKWQAGKMGTTTRTGRHLSWHWGGNAGGDAPGCLP